MQTSALRHVDSLIARGPGLEREAWQARAAAHAARADALTAVWREARAAGRRHPVEDFLFVYYSYPPSLLRRWHPGEGVELRDAAGAPHADWRWYGPGSTPGSIAADAGAFRAEKAPLIAAVSRILRGTASRAPRLSCFGMHEWAMVYRSDETRHPVPLRLGGAGTDAVVEASALRCTHIDAFRFFTPDAVPRNERVLTPEGVPTRAAQPDLEQPGCLHANMDLYNRRYDKPSRGLYPAVHGCPRGDRATTGPLQVSGERSRLGPGARLQGQRHVG